MPVIKMLNGGRVTLPRELRQQARLQEGDLMEVYYENGVFILKPILAMSPDEARARMKELVHKSRSATADLSEDEINSMVEDALTSVRSQAKNV